MDFLILIVALIIATVIGIIYVVCQAAPYIGEALSSVTLPSLKLDIKRKDGKKKDKKDKKSNDIIQYLLTLEQRLYSNLTICNKYDALEQMRIIIDDLYKDNMPVYLEAKNKLKHNTWGALEEAWKLWHPTPSSHVEWIGENNRICVLKTTHSLYCECKKLHFLECSYDDHGSPDFTSVTYPDSIVNISDLYDTLSSDEIQKRGGAKHSLQEIAQKRMEKQLQKVINKWAKKNNCEPDFYKWRDANNLVPHEDTNCRTMRLVQRDAHTAFKHRGGVANAVNIRNHFS